MPLRFTGQFQELLYAVGQLRWLTPELLFSENSRIYASSCLASRVIHRWLRARYITRFSGAMNNFR